MQVFGLDVINNGIIISHHHNHHCSCDWCDKWNSWRTRSQTKDLPEAEIKGQFCVSHAYIGRSVLTCWWTTTICISQTNPNAITVSILAWTINWLVGLQTGKKWPARVSSLWWQPEWDGRHRSQMCGYNTCVLVWWRSAGCVSACMVIHCWGLPAGWRINKPVGKKHTQERRGACLENKTLVMRAQTIRCICLII